MKKLVECTDQPEVICDYRNLLNNLIIGQAAIQENGWDLLVEGIFKIARCIATSSLTFEQCKNFWGWLDEACHIDNTQSAQQKVLQNRFIAKNDDRSVEIHLNSIHGVKGQTHLATLVLDTYMNGHFFEKMLPWLLGCKNNGVKEGKQNLMRLKQAYVAMTRPTHLLCLAIPYSSLGAENIDNNIAILKKQGWNIIRLE